jgi:hypothetical protein
VAFTHSHIAGGGMCIPGGSAVAGPAVIEIGHGHPTDWRKRLSRFWGATPFDDPDGRTSAQQSQAQVAAALHFNPKYLLRLVPSAVSNDLLSDIAERYIEICEERGSAYGKTFVREEVLRGCWQTIVIRLAEFRETIGGWLMNFIFTLFGGAGEG